MDDAAAVPGVPYYLEESLLARLKLPSRVMLTCTLFATAWGPDTPAFCSCSRLRLHHQQEGVQELHLRQSGC